MMKNLLIICAVAGVIMVSGITAKAEYLTFQFNPNDIVDLYNAGFTGLKATQDNARRVHKVWATDWYQTFADYLDAGTTQRGSTDTYFNWLFGLGENEGLGSFSTWLHGDPGARSWGEILLADPDKPMYATTASGWDVTIVDNPWDTGYGAGKIVVWYTTDPDLYLRPGGADIGTFSFTADVYVDTDENNNILGDLDAQAGVPYRIWFADTCMNQGDDNVPALVFDDQGWGTLIPNYGTFAQTPGGDAAIEAILTIAPIPEPATICLLGLGGLALLRRRKS